jgi:predicted ATPase
MRQAFISRVMLKSYKSIAICDVPLTSLTFLVGPNGSGKSNFLDALRLVTDSLTRSLEHALKERGGFDDVRRRSVEHPNHFAIRLEFNLRDGSSGHYSFQIGARYPHGYEVQIEECSVQKAGLTAWFKVRGGQASGSSPTVPPASPDRLYLVNAAGLPEFRPVYDALSRMGFYSLNPDRMREFQTPDAGDRLARDGSNIASVLERMEKYDPTGKHRIEEYLNVIVPGIQKVRSLQLVGQREALEFLQHVEGSENPWSFLARNVSDGTLRSLGVLVSLFQSSNGDASSIPLVGIEEPESGLHPAATAVVLDSIIDASDRTQVIVTSHSPTFLDDKDLPVESVLALVAENGKTRIADLDEVGRSALRDHLYTAGELLGMNQLRPDANEIAFREQPRLFDITG